MRFMTIVKSDESWGFPPQELFDAIGELGEKEMKEGVLLEMGGLTPSAAGARVRLSGGKITVHDGPFTEAKELIGGYAIFELQSKEDAIERAKVFLELHKKHWPGWEGESEIRQMFDAPPDGHG